MNLELERLIDLSLSDGVISVKEMQVILNKADRLGITADEVEIIIESKKNKFKKNKTNTKISPISNGLNKNNNLNKNKKSKTVGDSFLESFNYEDNIFYLVIIKPILFLLRSLFSIFKIFFKE